MTKSHSISNGCFKMDADHNPPKQSHKHSKSSSINHAALNTVCWRDQYYSHGIRSLALGLQAATSRKTTERSCCTLNSSFESKIKASSSVRVMTRNNWHKLDDSMSSKKGYLKRRATSTPHFIGAFLYCALHYTAFFKLKVRGNPVLRKCISIIFPISSDDGYHFLAIEYF